MRMFRLLLFGAVLGSLVVPAVASAASIQFRAVGWDGCGLIRWEYTAAPGEINRLTARSTPTQEAASGRLCEFPGDFPNSDAFALFSDSVHISHSTEGPWIEARCTHATRSTAQCSYRYEVDAIVQLGDMDDTADTRAIHLTDGRLYVFAGPGDDSLVTAGGRPDTIDCGAGIDTVHADMGDTVAANCEFVTRY